MKITARDKRFLIVGAVVVAATALFYLSDLIPSREGVSSTLEARRQMLLRQKEVLRQEEDYKARIVAYEEKLKQVRSRLLPVENPSIAAAELQRILKDLADLNGVEIIRKDIQREQRVQDDLVKVSVRIETNCMPDQLVQFIAAIENYERFLTLEELAVNSFRIQRRYEIRPVLTVSGYIAAPAPPPAQTASAGQ